MKKLKNIKYLFCTAVVCLAFSSCRHTQNDGADSVDSVQNGIGLSFGTRADLSGVTLDYTLYVFRAAGGGTDYVYTGTSYDVSNGSKINVDIRQLEQYDYRFFFFASEDGDDNPLTVITDGEASLTEETAWEDMRLKVSDATRPVGLHTYYDVVDMTGAEIETSGRIKADMERLVGQMAFDFYRVEGGNVDSPVSKVNAGTETALDRITDITITYTGFAEMIAFDGTTVKYIAPTEPTQCVQDVEVTLTGETLLCQLPQGANLRVFSQSVLGGARVMGDCFLPCPDGIKVDMVFTYRDDMATCGEDHTHTAGCFDQRAVRLNVPKTGTLDIRSNTLTVSKAGLNCDRVVDIPIKGTVTEIDYVWANDPDNSGVQP